MKRPILCRIGAIVVTGAILLSACGDDAQKTGAETEGASTASAPTGEPIRIGTMIWSEPAAALDRRVPGIQAAVDAINASGGIKGRPLEWELCEAADPNQGAQCARDFVAKGIVATVGDADMIAEAASTQILREGGVAQIDPFLSAPDAINSSNVYLVSPAVPIQFAGIVQYMHIMGKKRLHILAGAVSVAQANIDATLAAAEHFGIKADGTTEIPLSAADYTPMVSAAEDVGADTNVAIIGPFMTDLLLQAAKQLDIPLRLGISERQFNQEQYQTYGQPDGPLDGALLVDAIPPISTAEDHPELARALSEIKTYYEKTGDEKAEYSQLNGTVIQAWLDVQAFKAVVEDLDQITPATVMNALETAKDVDLGLIPAWTPSAKGPPGYEAVSNPWMYLSTVKDGKVVLYQDDPIDASLPFQE